MKDTSRPASSPVARRALVTGGSGFLGGHLCERLVAAAHDVLCIDNSFTGRRANVAHLLGQPNFELQRHDVTFPLYVQVDEIYNPACPASPVHCQHDPKQRRPDTGLATRELGWRPKVALRDGLVRTIEHFDTLARAGFV